jgi:hypothetical protein
MTGKARVLVALVPALLVRQAGDRRADRKNARAAAGIRSAFEIGGSLLVLVFAVALLF